MITNPITESFRRRFSYQRWWWKLALLDLLLVAGLLLYAINFAEPMPIRGTTAFIVSVGVLYSLCRVAWQGVLALVFAWRRQWEMMLLAAFHAVVWWCVYRLIGYALLSGFLTNMGEGI